MGIANEALSTIQGSVIEIHKLNTSIVTATTEQLEVSDEISGNLSNIKQLSLSMNTVVNQLEPFVVDLERNVGDLNKVVSSIRIVLRILSQFDHDDMILVFV